MATGSNNLTSYYAKEIKNIGASYSSEILGRDYAPIKIVSYDSNYNPLWSLKSNTGDWTVSTNNDSLFWTYTPDTQYELNNNNNYIQMSLSNEGDLHIFSATRAYDPNNTGDAIGEFYVTRGDIGISMGIGPDNYMHGIFSDAFDDNSNNHHPADWMIYRTADGTVWTSAKLSSAPNNTTTFYRGDNTWSNTLTGQLYINYSEDVNLGSNGSLIIGDKGSTNIGIDNNEIMARNNGAASTLYLNSDGGSVYISSGSYYINAGTFTGRSYALKDKTNNNWTYLDYGASALGIGSITYLGCWNGYTLGSINKTAFMGNINGTARVIQVRTGTYSALSHSTSTTRINFSTGFSNGCYGVVAFCNQLGWGAVSTVTTGSWDRTGFYVNQFNGVSARMNIAYIAIGY